MPWASYRPGPAVTKGLLVVLFGMAKIGRPPKHGTAMTAAQRMREYRERKRLAAAPVPVPVPVPAGDPIDALAAWSERVLVVPPGHPLAGNQMVLPDFAVSFLRDAVQHRESLLCMARKNAKSAIVAVYLLSKMVGPLHTDGWRGSVTSVNKQKAGELKTQMQAIAEASELQGLRFLRSPTPGRVEADGATLDILAADASAGHAAGYDDAVIDETGLLQERDRALVNGLRSSTSARNGRVIHLSIHGTAPFIDELLEAADDPAVCVHHHAPPEDADMQDPVAWRAANPGLGTIKSLSYMTDTARLAAANPNNAPDFRSHDMNLPGEPSREMICTPEQWQRCVTDRVPPREGVAVVGLDAGGSASMTAAVVAFPQTGRVEAYAAFPGDPDLLTRGRGDAVGRRYQLLADAGELMVYPGRSTPVVEFLRDLADGLEGVRVAACGADRYRRAEVEDALSDANLRWPLVLRGQGASATADGSADVRSFQRCVLDASIACVVGKRLMVHAIAESAIRRDALGNPSLEKGRKRGRIDALSAAVIAAGLCERHRARARAQPRRRRYAIT